MYQIQYIYIPGLQETALEDSSIVRFQPVSIRTEARNVNIVPEIFDSGLRSHQSKSLQLL